MESWSFPSKNHGEIEGYANPGMEMFKDNPLQALTREICQNSLDAADGDKTVEVEFRKYDMQLSKFPGMYEMERIIHRCIDFWGENANRKTQVFLDNALEVLSENRLRVLRVSDFTLLYFALNSGISNISSFAICRRFLCNSNPDILRG